jgi:hypothetical protein
MFIVKWIGFDPAPYNQKGASMDNFHGEFMDN